MTHFLRDILRQPEELRRTLEHLSKAGKPALDAATATIRNARHVYLTGIGSSWHAALNVGALFYQSARPVYMQDAAELLQYATFPPGAAIIIISRSGRSIEIVQLVAKARAAGATVIAVTNAPDGPLAKEAQISIVVPIALDHAISVNTYTTLALAAGMLADGVVRRRIEFPQGLKPNEKGPRMSELKLRPPTDSELASTLSQSIAETARAIPGWQKQIADTTWLLPGAATYFLARGSSLGSCYEARLLWEEGVKSPATAMGTGSFRHGPQEMIAKDFRFGMWIDAAQMREQDLAVARDLRQLGASVLLIGQNLPRDAADLVFQLPAIPPAWQFLIDIIPAQLAAERLSRLSGVDCDSFRLCSFVVEDEYGLLPQETRKERP
jgi:glucosamine--fructose-6-phosphate aminotransferase (isomerizing)